ncbi:MAG: response regulator, partial [Lachnospiraceae bacterium]|nr:response regulator [Lachnospiraceae bacterium]
PCIMALWALFRAIRKQPYRKHTMHYRTFIVLCIIPSAVLILYSCKVIRGYDPCPLTLEVILSVVVIFVWAKQNYDLSRVAATTVLADIDDCVIFLDNAQRISGYNPAAQGIFITLNEDSIGNDIRELDNFPMEIFETVGHYEFQLHGGYFEGHLKVIRDKKDILRGYVLLIFDITKTKNYIAEITQMRERAEKANSVKTEFLANMSHEIRTPMNAIVGLSDLIKQESKGRKIYNYACDIQASSENLLGILNNILNISKFENGELELTEKEYYIKRMLNEVVVMMERSAVQQGLEMRFCLDDDVPCKLLGDEGSIRQILINLMNNALKFTREGYVKLMVGGHYTTGDTWNLTLKVEDSGIGIREDDIAEIFENFNQVDTKKNRSAGGTGLGLSISRKLAELMDGKIEVESVYGEGSTFTVTIPQQVVDKRTVSENISGQEPEGENEMRMFTAPDYKVLVVDDNLINRQVAAGMLKPYGCQLTKAQSGPEAIELVRQEKFDMIFMDHMMPDMDGVEATKVIREECGENGRTPIVIALTANAMPGMREMFLSNGFQDFLAKPVDREPMFQMLDKWIPDRRKVYEEEQKTDGGAGGAQDELADIVIEGVDIKKAMEYHTGTVDDYLELLQLFYMDGLRKTKYLQELFECEDIKNYRIEVHGLKSASANIGAMELSGKAKEQEDAAIAEDTAFIQANYPEMMELYKKLLGEIKMVLEKKGRLGAQDDSAKPELEAGALADAVKEALDLVSHFKPKPCAAKVEWLLEHRLPPEIRTQLSDIQMKLKMYEDDDAEEMLREIAEKL